jgi:hypothetical protein
VGLPPHPWLAGRFISSMLHRRSLVPGGALLGTLLGAAHYDAASGTVRTLPRLADPRVYTVMVEGDEALFGTEGGLSRLTWAPTGTSMAGVSLPRTER